MHCYSKITLCPCPIKKEEFKFCSAKQKWADIVMTRKKYFYEKLYAKINKN